MPRYRILAIVAFLALVVSSAGSMLAVRASHPIGAPVASATLDGTPSAATTTTGHLRHRTDPSPGSTDGDAAPVDEPDNRAPGRSGPAEDPTAAPGESVRDVMPGGGSAPPAAPARQIGDLDDQRPIPAGLGLATPPTPTPAPADQDGPSGLAVEPSCSHQCISRGVAYARGFGAELIVETTVPARLFISVVADLDDDGSYEYGEATSTPYAVTEHSWALDHLEPGQTYHAMAAATDEDGYTAYVWGELTTLSTRDVFVVFGDGEVVGGPDDITTTTWHLGLDGPLTDVTPGQQGILLYQDLPRHIDLDFWVLRSWDDDLCESWVIDGALPQGHDTGSCVAWNSTRLDDVDLDTIPAGASRWTETSVAVSLHPPTGAGDALPPGYGDPYSFSFEVPVTLHVTYS